jgi:hypothetical protein
MNKKLIFVFICIFLFLNISTVSRSINSQISGKKLQNDYYANETDLPIWKVGDSWIYDIELISSPNSIVFFNGKIKNLMFRVSDDLDESYKLEFEGEVTGEMTINVEDIPVSGSLKDAIITGNAVFEKSIIGIKNLFFQFNGKLVVVFIPIPLNVDLTLAFEPIYNSLNFPLYIGKQWNIPFSVADGTAYISILKDSIMVFASAGGGTAECISIENISVKAGTYETYKINTDLDISEIYYAPSAGNIIKAVGSTNDFDEISIELTATTYEEPGAPNIPSIPSGPKKGKPDTEYTYSTSTTDSEGDQIYYWFEWGDGTDSNWIGAYNSGEIMNASHTWAYEGTFNIRVKAKDTENHVSKWSDPLRVIMPKNKPINSPFLQFFENHPHLFPLLRQLLIP